MSADALRGRLDAVFADYDSISEVMEPYQRQHLLDACMAAVRTTIEECREDVDHAVRLAFVSAAGGDERAASGAAAHAILDIIAASVEKGTS